MITAFTVKNFKAIGDDPVRIELKPITLLFGANSTGKSSILHALNYAEGLFKPGILNADEDLGGFKRYIHSGDLNRNLVLRFELDFVVSRILDLDLELKTQRKYGLDSRLHPRKLLSSAVSAYVEVEVAWSSIRQHPYVSRYETGINGERVAIICYESKIKQGILRYLNTAHPIFIDLWIEHGICLDYLIETIINPKIYNRKLKVCEEENEPFNECQTPQSRKQLFERLGRIPSTAFSLSQYLNNIDLVIQTNLHPWDMSFDDISLSLFWQPHRVEDTDLIMINHEDSENTLELTTDTTSYDFENLFDALLVMPGKQVADWLYFIRYLGPLREIPSRNFSSYQQQARWSTGLAAWRKLYSLGKKQLDESVHHGLPKDSHDLGEVHLIDFIDTVNDWLASVQKLNTGYRVVIERYREISSDDPIFRFVVGEVKLEDLSEFIKQINLQPEKIHIRLEDISCGLKLEPHEIGTGISQVLPVVVAAIDGDAYGFASESLVAIEQPELHIHPAVQVQLGDLFITQINKFKGGNRPKLFLIETHSEYLLLRLLRRINETYENRLPPDITPCTPDDVAIYYLEKESQGLRIRRLEISEDGDSKGDWPEGFFEERRAELF